MRLASSFEDRATPQDPAELRLGFTGRELRRAMLQRSRAVLRRQVNVLIAFVAVILAGPAMLAIAAIIKVLSPGPALDRKVRVGLDRRLPLFEPVDWRREVDQGGRPFTLLVFRTTSAGRRGGPRGWRRLRLAAWRRVAGFLRRWGLDKLPQLLNVLRGELNIVGPRPEPPFVFAAKRSGFDSYARRQRVLPGITGLAQLHQLRSRAPTSVRRQVELDLQYIDRESVLQDLRIIVATLIALARRAVAGRSER